MLSARTSTKYQGGRLGSSHHTLGGIGSAMEKRSNAK